MKFFRRLLRFRDPFADLHARLLAQAIGLYGCGYCRRPVEDA